MAAAVFPELCSRTADVKSKSDTELHHLKHSQESEEHFESFTFCFYKDNIQEFKWNSMKTILHLPIPSPTPTQLRCGGRSKRTALMERTGEPCVSGIHHGIS